MDLSVSYGKNASRERIIAVPVKKIVPAGAIRIHRFPKKILSATTMKIAITTKSHIHVHEKIS